jgi:hypothetical protein
MTSSIKIDKIDPFYPINSKMYTFLKENSKTFGTDCISDNLLATLNTSKTNISKRFGENTKSTKTNNAPNSSLLKDST